MPKKILFINDTTAHGNWGAQATPLALKEMLDLLMPEAEVAWLTHAWLRQTYFALQMPFFRNSVYRRGVIPHLQWILDKVSRPVTFFPEVADDFETYAKRWMAGLGGPPGDAFVRLASGSDLVVYNAENSIYRNTTEGCHGLFLLWVAKTQLHRTTCIINQTAHLNGVRPIMQGMVRKLYPKLDLVTTREPYSLDCLKKLGIANALLVPDPVFGLSPDKSREENCIQWLRKNRLEKHAYFCLSTSGLPSSRPYGQSEGAVTALVRKLKKSTSLQAVLVAKDGPCRFLEEVARRTDSVYFGPGHDLGELLPLFEKSAFLITGHYHYAIWAAMAGCPFIPFSTNNHKMQGLCKLLETPCEEPFDITDLSSCGDRIVDEAQRVWHARAAISAHLLEKASDFRDQAALNIRYLRKLLFEEKVPTPSQEIDRK